MSTQEKIRQIRQELNGFFIERDEEIDCLLTAVLSRHHVLLLGPPGTAKSLACRAIASHITGCVYFERLLTKFTTPEEVFGVYDLKKLTNGVYERITTNKLPEAHIAFLDEIFKSSSAILNSLLTIINEGIFYNDGAPQDVPLISLVTASNELPDEDEGLEAMYDRLLIRKTVEYIKDARNLKKLLTTSNEYVPNTTIGLDELNKAITEAQSVKVPESVINSMIEVKYELEKEGVRISDRRFKQSLDAVKAYAYLNGRIEAVDDDIAILQYIYWTDPEEIPVVKSTVLKVANPYAQKAEEILGILNDFEEEAKKYETISQQSVEIFQKIYKIIKQLDLLIAQAKNAGKNVEPLKKVRGRAMAIYNRMKKEMLLMEEDVDEDTSEKEVES